MSYLRIPTRHRTAAMCLLQGLVSLQQIFESDPEGWNTLCNLIYDGEAGHTAEPFHSGGTNLDTFHHQDHANTISNLPQLDLMQGT